MKLTDFPPEKCLQTFYGILDRYNSARKRWPEDKGIRTEAHLSVDDARAVFAAGQWLERYDSWSKESGGKIGVWPANHSLPQCVAFIKYRVAKMDKAQPVLILPEKDMKVVEAIAQHLDHYALLLSFESGRKRKR